MSKDSIQYVSSLMDGEISPESGMFLTRRLASDAAMCAKWERYHLIRDCIRQPGSKQIVMGLSVRLSASLDAEQVPSQSAWRGRGWIKPVSGLAIAASVALLAIVITVPQPGTMPGEVGDGVLTEPVNKPFVSPNTFPLVPVSQPVSFSASGRPETNRLNAYLVRHNQVARSAGLQGFVSFVPIVATQSSVRVMEEAGDQKTADAGFKQEASPNK